MIRIAVVDDDIKICSHIERYMTSFSKKNQASRQLSL